MRVLFVCTGNTCRSPMAERLARRMYPQVDFTSAGVAALEGYSEPASDGARQVMAESGLDLSDHRSRPLTADLVDHAGLIVTMTRAQLEQVRQRFPQAGPRLRTLKPDADVEDPLAGRLEDYRKCACELERWLRELVLEVR